MLQMHQGGRNGSQEGAPSSDQINELTSSINRFLEVVEKGQSGKKTDDKDS
jgi:hypothetical protein